MKVVLKFYYSFKAYIIMFKIKHVLEEFKTFAMRGNVVDMAVGIILDRKSVV